MVAGVTDEDKNYDEDDDEDDEDEDGEDGRTPSVTAINGRPSPLSHRTGCSSTVTKHCQWHNGPRHRVL